MNHDWIDRYLYAVTKNFPSKLRSDIDAELRTLIDDLLEKRCGGLPASEQDIRAVLAELGTPAELAQKYLPHGDRCLIGPQYYLNYKFLLKIVLSATAFGLVVAGVLEAAKTGRAFTFFSLLSALGNLSLSLLIAFAMVTLLFTVFERAGVHIDFNFDTLENLPPVPKKQAEIPKWEPMAGIVFSVVFGIVFLAVPQIIFAIVNGRAVPIFNVQLVHASWYIAAALFAVGALRDAYKLFVGRYTLGLLAVNTISNFVSAFLTAAFLQGGKIFNAELFILVSPLLNENEFLISAFAKLPLLLLGIILFALLIDTISVAVRCLRYRI